MAQLSVEEVLVLNNLMYMNGNDPFKDIKEYQGKTIGDLVSDINTGKIKISEEYTTFTTGEEWKNIIEYVRSNEKLQNTKIEACYDDGNGGRSVLFHNTTDNEAIAVYRGTGSGKEWKDNFEGGSLTDQTDQVSTAQQEGALEWFRSQNLDQYDSVTVSGHSKGGNKAKYVTLMDDSVDRCLSFDGQGFSDEFVNKYQEKIAQNQYKIQNHNIAGDYVNILLNDVGERFYYEGYNYGDGKFIENHCPNTYMKFDENGNFVMVPTEQNQDVQNLDYFLNNYLRTLSPEERYETMQLIGTLVESAQNGSSINELLDIFLEGNYTDRAASLVAYFIKYAQEKPEIANSIRNILKEMGYEEFIKYVDTIQDTINNKYFEKILNVIDWTSGKIPNWVLRWFSKWLWNNYQISLSEKDLQKLLRMIHTANKDMEHIHISDNGEDLKVQDIAYEKTTTNIFSTSHKIRVETMVLHDASEQLRNQKIILAQVAEVVSSVRQKSELDMESLIRAMALQEQQLKKLGKCYEQLSDILQNIAQEYEKTEKKAALV